MIREELDRLPDSYRQPLMLCYLEGLTHQEAASRLGWPVGTVKVRLVRGRRLMRERLDRRGASLGAGLLLCLLNPSRAAAVPQPLLESTVRAMILGAAGRRSALQSKFAGALGMAEATLGVAIGLKAHWLWPSGRDSDLARVHRLNRARLPRTAGCRKSTRQHSRAI